MHFWGAAASNVFLLLSGGSTTTSRAGSSSLSPGRTNRRRSCCRDSSSVHSALSSWSDDGFPGAVGRGGSAADDDGCPEDSDAQQRRRQERASELIDKAFVPQSEYGKRLRIGRDANGLPSGKALSASDPTLSFTYGEFPLNSLDVLLDEACRHLNESPSSAGNYYDASGDGIRHRLNVVDLGSGCGRLCLYMALTRTNWDVSGIEIADELHNEAVESLLRASSPGQLQQDQDSGRAGGWFTPLPDCYTSQVSAENTGSSSSSLKHAAVCESTGSTLSLVLGSAQEHCDIISEADIIFAYSTTWETKGFSEEAGAMVLSDEWDRLLSSTCRDGCVVITTDRALDPSSHGSCWNPVGRLDVDNREVFGSVGYIQQRRART